MLCLSVSIIAILFCRYIEWVSHEPQPGKYVFDGNLDIEKYFQLAQYYNLSVILRPGPYIDAERDMVRCPSFRAKNWPTLFPFFVREVYHSGF